ncbi:MAG: hypothetical protein ABGX87_01265 [Alcanivorax sp.]|uniref:Uncharacterized protein n=1 Tax=Alloalcanivorax marinus TaxID=1177169 RepID=A0A9Q3UM39_9GAMM|nr:hypothetical protein [Alloalcanivorax marinus]MCC4309756.1 hypothetical protein [Alloalcanivorax marinus]
MESEGPGAENPRKGSFTYISWRDHLLSFIKAYWRRFFLYVLALFGVIWGVIEAANFFFPGLNLDSLYALGGVLSLCVLGSTIRCGVEYRNAVPEGMENESLTAQNIVRSKRPFWEFALAHELVSSRIEKIDIDLDDLLHDRVNVKVDRNMDVDDYIGWLKMRPDNLSQLVDVSKQLFVFDLVNTISVKEGDEVDLKALIRVADLIEKLYRDVYVYEVEGRSIKIPEEFGYLHSLQSQWAVVISDAVSQLLNILDSVANRTKDDLSPVEAKINFKAPPRINEFSEELDRLRVRFDL